VAGLAAREAQQPESRRARRAPPGGDRKDALRQSVVGEVVPPASAFPRALKISDAAVMVSLRG